MRHAARRCPACNTLCNIHCRTRVCRWFVCPRQACQAVLDFARGVGYQLLPGDVVRPFTFPRNT